VAYTLSSNTHEPGKADDQPTLCDPRISRRFRCRRHVVGLCPVDPGRRRAGALVGKHSGEHFYHYHLSVSSSLSSSLLEIIVMGTIYNSILPTSQPQWHDESIIQRIALQRLWPTAQSTRQTHYVTKPHNNSNTHK
jgi:hypothetical protein